MSAFLLSVEWQLRTAISFFSFSLLIQWPRIVQDFHRELLQTGWQGRKTHFLMDIAALLIYPHRRSKGDRSLVQFLLSPQFKDRVCSVLISIPSVFGLFARVTLPEKEILGGIHKGLKHKILVPVFHVFPNFTDAVDNAQYIWGGCSVASCSEHSTCGTVWPTTH